MPQTHAKIMTVSFLVKCLPGACDQLFTPSLSQKELEVFHWSISGLFFSHNTLVVGFFLENKKPRGGVVGGGGSLVQHLAGHYGRL